MPTAADTLLEREREVSMLDALIAAAATGEAAIVSIEGPSGIGKTRLIAQARLRAAEAEFTVLSSRGSELERDFGFGVVRQLFERVVSDDPARLRRGAAAPAERIFSLTGGGDGTPADDNPSFASLHGLYWLTAHLADDGPLLLALDDLQWCDAPSLRFMAYLRTRLEGMPILVVTGVRADERVSDRGLIEAVVGEPSTVRIRPHPLSHAAVTAMVRRRLGPGADAGFCTACYRATAGNPLLTTELLKALAAEGVRPQRQQIALIEELGQRSISRAVLLRLSRLPPDATAVAQAVAVLGDDSEPSTIAALAGLDEGRAEEAMTSLVRAEILRAPPRVGFVHPLVRATIYNDVLLAERHERHRRAAELLSGAGARAQRVAGQLLLVPSRGEEWAVEALTTAAQRAIREGAPESAAAYLSRALAEDPAGDRRGELLLALGRAEALTSGPAAAEHLQQAYALLTDPRERAVAAQVLGRALLFTGSPDRAAEVARKAAAELPAELRDLRDALEAFEFFCALFGAGDRGRVLGRLQPYRTASRGAGIGAKMLAAIAAQAWMYAGGPSDAVSELSLTALAGGELIAADNGLLANCAITTLTFADRPEALEWWEAASAEAHRRGSLFAASAVSLWRGHALYRRGELIDAEQSLRTCRLQLDQWGYHELQAQIYCDAHLSSVLRARGDLAGARRALERSHDEGGSDDGARYWLGSAIELLLAELRFEEAEAATNDYADRFDDLVRNPMDAPWRSHKAQALGHLGRRDEALELVADELELARAWGAPATIARSLRTLGTLERERGLDHLEEAVALVAGSPARLEHAHALTALGETLRRMRRPTAAREPLRAALEIAGACGADGLAGRIRTELYATGARPRAATLTGVGSLTATERRVAELAAQGATNREAAEALFVAPKTVEMHLGNVYRKLGISSRRDLRAALSE